MASKYMLTHKHDLLSKYLSLVLAQQWPRTGTFLHIYFYYV